MRSPLSILGICLITMSIFLGGCTNNEQSAVSSSSAAASSASSEKSTAPISDARNTPIVQAAKKVGPAVVGITNKAVARDWFNRQVEIDKGTGSGVIFRSDGYIVTNNHVIEGAKDITVALADGRTLPATLVGTDPYSDLAVIKVDATDLPTAEFGNSDDIMVGEPAIAIGNPLGLEFQGSVTAGVISALNRTLTIGDNRLKLLQTDAAINPGNSGGALLNMNGEVIGINSNKIGGTAVEGMGYAIPITSASPIIADLMERQTRTKVAEDEVGYIGISQQEVTSQISQMYNMPEGIYVVSVEEGSAAANAGIMKGDIITKFDGSSISSYSDLQKTLQYYAAGDSVTVTVQRPQNGEYVSIELNLTLGSRPASQK